MIAMIMAISVAFQARSNYSCLDTTINDQLEFKSIIAERNTIAGKTFTTSLNPQAVSFVQEYIRKQGKELEKMRTWAKPYFDVCDVILPQYGVPKELKYLSVIESHFQSNLVSWAGAVGPWQLMDYEAHRFGLRTGRFNDERTDFYKSTHVAAKLLKELYDEFGDWLLVVAAYNGGAGRIRQAIDRTGSRDFWTIQYLMREETRTHVKKYIATHYLFEGGGGLTTMTANESKKFLANQTNNNSSQLSAEEMANSVLIEINGRFNSTVVINYLLLEADQFNKWNPGFDKALAEGKAYLMRLPKDRLSIFEAKRGDILLASIRLLLDGNVSAIK
jgi:membrane-bound lytic murein transglycosylase D